MRQRKCSINRYTVGRRKKTQKKREEELLLNYKDENTDSEAVSQGTQPATISSNFDDYPTTLPKPVHYRNGM